MEVVVELRMEVAVEDGREVELHMEEARVEQREAVEEDRRKEVEEHREVVRSHQHEHPPTPGGAGVQKQCTSA